MSFGIKLIIKLDIIMIFMSMILFLIMLSGWGKWLAGFSWIGFIPVYFIFTDIVIASSFKNSGRLKKLLILILAIIFFNILAMFAMGSGMAGAETLYTIIVSILVITAPGFVAWYFPDRAKSDTKLLESMKN